MPRERKIIGLDLGTASVGWAYLKLSSNGNNIVSGEILGSNSRIFPAAVEGRGKDQKPKNKGRRDARHQRRQHRRKRQRRNKLRTYLIESGLLPNMSTDQLNAQFSDMRQFDPFALRTRALESRLEPYEIGRALFHLAKRRGFRSSRLHGKPKEDGPVLKEIGNIKANMASAGYVTPGAYLNSLEKKRGSELTGRRGYMARDDHEKEFERIWERQSSYYPNLLTAELKTKLWDSIFTQREPRWDRGLIGKCTFDPKKKRCFLAHQDAQRFRYWQDINNIRVQNTDTYERFPLTSEQKEHLATVLENAEKIEVASIPRRLKMKGSFKVNLSGSKKHLYGNRTAAAFRTKHFKQTWEGLREDQRDKLINAIYRIGDDDRVLTKHLAEKWNLDRGQIESVLNINLEQNYSRHSLRAIREMLPFMRQGYRYDEAFRLAKYKRAFRSAWDLINDVNRERVFSDLILFKGSQTDITHLKIRWGFSDSLIELVERTYADIKTKFDPLGLEELEPLDENLRNPIVQKALTQVRKVVNELIRTYGKPDEIHVELGRELKMTQLQKEAYEKQQRLNEKLNREAEVELAPLNNNHRVTGKQKQLYRLWKENNGVCMYTGKSIPLQALVGDEIEIDHIIPYERCWDDSYMNKTICLALENQEKGKKTPREHYGGDEDRFYQILTRAENLPETKRKKFEMTTQEVAEIDWAGRQLSDTRYISKKVRDYLIQLFDKPEAVSIVTGQSTEMLRRNWGLNGILQQDGTDAKNRRDHRHHAIDAIVVALTDRELFNVISTLAGRNKAKMHSMFRDFPQPWPSFRSDVESAMKKLEAPTFSSLEDAITVSLAPTRRVRGEYFKQEAYYKLSSGKFVHRVALSKISNSNLSKIVDVAVREIVRARLDEHAGNAQRAFAEPLLHKDGKTPIRKVRVIEDKFVERKAHVEYHPDGTPIRFYASGGNHHAEVFENIATKKRRVKVITLHEAFENIRQSINQGEVPSPNSWEFQENERPLFTLAANDLIEYRGIDGALRVFRIQKMSQSGDETTFEIVIRPPYDGFTEPNEGTPIRIRSRESLLGIIRKLQVDPLGRLTQARD